MTTAEVLSAAPAAAAVRFLGKEAVYWRLRLKGAALLLLTLGLYRFWFATDVRRFLWSNTEIGGETLEYAGLATELLGGFLLAIAILVPLYTALAGAALALDTAVATTLSSFVLLVLLGQFALYRARRYRLTRTVFRGVRFDQHGSAWRYAVYALLWWTLAVLTLGLVYPWAEASLQRFKMRHTSYGDLAGSFEASGSALFLRGLPIWLLVVGPIIIAFFALGTMIDWNSLDSLTADQDSNPLAVLAANADLRVFGIGIAAFCVSVAAALLLYPLFQAIVLRWWISGLRFGEVGVTSRLRAGPVYRIYLRFAGLTALFLGLTFAVLGVGLFVAHRFAGPDLDSAVGELWTSAVSFCLYVVIVFGVSTIYQVAVSFAMWRFAAQTAELSDAGRLDAVRADGAASSALGEGLADALGVGGI